MFVFIMDLLAGWDCSMVTVLFGVGVVLGMVWYDLGVGCYSACELAYSLSFKWLLVVWLLECL